MVFIGLGLGTSELDRDTLQKNCHIVSCAGKYLVSRQRVFSDFNIDISLKSILNMGISLKALCGSIFY